MKAIILSLLFVGSSTLLFAQQTVRIGNGNTVEHHEFNSIEAQRHFKERKKASIAMRNAVPVEKTKRSLYPHKQRRRNVPVMNSQVREVHPRK